MLVPMLKESEIGRRSIYRQEIRPLHHKTDRAGENFAAQAVIAIENTRLLNELRQRTMTKRCWSSRQRPRRCCSHLKLAGRTRSLCSNPCWQIAKRLCGAKFGMLSLREGDAFRTVALHGATVEYTEARWRAPLIRPAAEPALAVYCEPSR